MEIALVILLYITLFIYLYVFIRKTSNTIYKIHHNKKENINEQESFKIFNIYKITSYIIMLIILFIGILIAPHIRLLGWIYLFYILWGVGLLFVKLNISLLDHFINVIYIGSRLDSIEKEYLIGAIMKEKHRYYISYRLTLDKLYI